VFAGTWNASYNGKVIIVLRLDAVEDIRLEEKTLSFEFVDNDGDTDKFRMELSDRNSATLSWVGLPNGMKAKAIALTKQSPRSK
jgi:hypothetical protein